ncbi:rho GTPase-activating protein 20-like [Meriones unguiculatus]|uniref:rho GTPase-activating protein 20-like n=1 Tax=Meriones unguiculatus TaxID=10047 RepID=UPI00293EA21E|nr:rho GTPase-activating protein 20-like [Meriones unguiculatus]
MPRPNLILLRHLMHLLHEIKSHSSIWFVNAHILSFRIADSLLWKDTADYSISETDFSKRVSLIKLLIDYFPKIFKEDTSKLYKDVQRSLEDIKNSSGDKSPDKADADNQMDIGTTFFSSTIDHPVEDDN